MHSDVADGGVPLAAITTSASVHDSQVAIPLMQMSSELATIFYDLADSAYDAKEIKDFSNNLGHISIHLKVHLHLMFGIIAITVKQLFNMLN